MRNTARVLKRFVWPSLVLVLLSGGPTFAQQFQAAVRITNCIGFQQESLDATILCNASGFIERDGLGLFVQVTPRYGPFYDNWQVRGYTSRIDWDLGIAARFEQVGVTVGRELGDYFIRFESDIVFQAEW